MMKPGLLRSRWAAVGAAVAVTLGGGTVWVASAATPTAPTSFVATDPTRVLDTREPSSPIKTLGFGSNVTLSLASVVPAGALAVSLNVTGWTLGTGDDHFALARYRKNGALDSGFGSAGRVTTDFGLQSSAAHAVAIQPDGRIVVAGVAGGGSTGADIALARYDAGGALDPSFGSGGRVLTDLGGGSFEAAFAMVLQPDGKIIVAGSTRPPGSYDDHPPD